MKKEVTRPLFGNCWLIAIWLWTTGRCIRLVLLSSDSGLVPHLAGITRKGNLLAFGPGRIPSIAKSCRFYPYWFKRQIRGCRRRSLIRVFDSRVLLGRLT